MTTRTLVEVAKDAVQLARAAGARQAAATASRDREVELEWRDGKVEKLSEATTAGLALELYVDGRYASVSTSDLRPDALRRFVEDAVEVTRALAPDPHRGLADPGLCARGPFPDLDLVDPAVRGVEPASRPSPAASRPLPKPSPKAPATSTSSTGTAPSGPSTSSRTTPTPAGAT